MIAFAACSDSSGGKDDAAEYITAAEAVADYRERATELSLAPGTVWEDEPWGLEAKDSDGVAVMYGLSVGRQQAEFWWLCSWQGRTLNTSGREREVALGEIEKFRGYEAYKWMDDNGHKMFESYLASARLGDMTEMNAAESAACNHPGG